MATKKTGRKIAARKSSAGAKRSTASKSASKRRHAVLVQGSVFVLSQSGARKIRSHVAKKASAREIEQRVGLSARKVSGARSLLARLEKNGLIERV